VFLDSSLTPRNSCNGTSPNLEITHILMKTLKLLDKSIIVCIQALKKATLHSVDSKGILISCFMSNAIMLMKESSTATVTRVALVNVWRLKITGYSASYVSSKMKMISE
jgi:hypothetical protein